MKMTAEVKRARREARIIETRAACEAIWTKSRSFAEYLDILHEDAQKMARGRYAYLDAKPGDPCSIMLYTDRIAARVVKVNRKSVVVERVACKPAVNEHRDGNPYPTVVAEGDVTKGLGGRETLPLERVRFGSSLSVTDYRY